VKENPISKSQGERPVEGRQPIIAITMGDAAGIGPEVVLKALADEEIRALCRPLVIGDLRVLEAAKRAARADPALRAVGEAAKSRFTPSEVDLLDLRNCDPTDVPWGHISPLAGGAAVQAVERAAKLALSGNVDAIVTAPLNKAAMRAAGCESIGHTEILADLCHAPRVTTMLVTGSLRVVHATRHVSLATVASLITRERVLETITLTDEGMQRWGMKQPRIGVAALNPHGGESGLLGREEIEEIGPAVRQAQAQGIEARGPVPADSIFFQAIRGEFDAVVAMYHDQGHIPIKTHGFEASVTITLGLPIVRTSVDHGTAFDIAGRGVADPTSMKEAIKLAVQIA
jgi:4-hydroxythreonine-4-phosphate dehydrogenase